MTGPGLAAAIAKMRTHGCTEAEVDSFAYSYGQWVRETSGLIPEAAIEPFLSPPTLVEQPDVDGADALAQTALIKLNGGLGTSMGLETAKTLLSVREGRTFLDLLAAQVMAARQRYGVRLPVVFMNSFRTRRDTLSYLEQVPGLPVPGIPLDFLQSQFPKIRQDNGMPVEWAADPLKEWSPPGHGEVFAGLARSGVLERLAAEGFRYVNISNGDNLGAAPDARLAQWFASSGAPFAAEVCARTPNDRKGGHLAVRKSDGRVILREIAQTPPEDVEAFMDAGRHPYFNTNNLWVDLVALVQLMEERGSHLGLPLIRNLKTVDPSDATSPAVVQLESAMGAAIEVFPGATAIEVERNRFLPVKTTNELLLVRSDLFTLEEDFTLRSRRSTLPRVELDASLYRLIPDFDQRFAYPVSLMEASSFSVTGDWTFGESVEVQGDVRLETVEPARIDDGTILTAAAGSRAQEGQQ